jgi:phospholipase C
VATISPFLIPQAVTDVNGKTVPMYPADTDSVDHSHRGIDNALDLGADGIARNDRYALNAEGLTLADGKIVALTTGQPATARPTLLQKQRAELVLAHLDCDTVPFLWRYADRFTLLDNFHMTIIGPSTPNAIAMIAGQAGETQWVKHAGDSAPAQPMGGTINGKTYSGTGNPQRVPLISDPNPYWGSPYDATANDRQPTSPAENYDYVAENLTFATVPLTAMGGQITEWTRRDLNGALDLADIQKDIPFIQNLNGLPVTWGWYQNGYDLEPSDANGVASHDNYVAHHEGPQYFGYLANNPEERKKMHGEGDFFADVQNHALPKEGGVFYIRGGFRNIRGATPPIQNPRYPNAAGLTAADLKAIAAAKSGDDDHPAYADRQISEAMNAEVVNAIAGDPELWRQSAIVITYDESDGFFDHAPPRILSYGPDGLPLARGVRVPLLLISPYARAHAASHAEGDHNAVIETINAIFNLPPLSSLPDEAEALQAGDSPAFNKFGPEGFHQTFLGPRDTNSPITDSLLSGFSPKRLRGEAPPLPAEYAMTPKDILWSLPHYAGQGCKAIGVTPEDQRQHISAPPPANFNTLPATLPAYN